MKTKLLILSLAMGFSLTAANSKKTPVYTLIKNAKRIVVVQDFMQNQIDLGGSFIKQTYESNPSEKIPVPPEYNLLNQFICESLNKKFEVSYFELGPDSIYYKKGKMMGKDVDIMDYSKIDADLIVRINYEIDYRGFGTIPEIPYEAHIRVKIAIFEPNGNSKPKNRINFQLAYIHKSIGNLENVPHNIDDPNLDADFFAENYNPKQYIDGLEPLIFDGVEKLYTKLVKKAK
ncbi:MAG: hypothetical protein KAH07_08080 [Flavobacteriaceae bacterium]|nr:hypothetical protein [Flavobacteriaceae bacterium]